MKYFIYHTLIAILLLCVLFLLILDAKKEQQQSNQIHFIWNDVEKNIPSDGSIIRIEFTDENNVYIGPVKPKVKPMQEDLDSIQEPDVDAYLNTGL